ncbi:FecR family protein [Gabonibacter chumensis]|uniref:FecR family protein n=1 Tax=Gabonibacter chumensis TaxID=2972474 RepID=UPI0025729F0C|nr:FecR domain-containing protein [Gabonibacter chumensis]MCR9011117.1 DUF4974 domain-containing protein [Gabonibacter chumensis]
MKEKEIDEILSDILVNNTLTKEEIQTLEEWKHTSSKNEEFVKIVQRLKLQKQILDKHQKQDTVFAKIERQVIRIRKKRRHMYWSSCAASAMLLLGLFFTLKWENPSRKEIPLNQIPISCLSPTKPTVELVLPDGKKQSLGHQKSTVILSDSNREIRTEKQTLIIETNNTKNREPEYFTMNVPFGAEYNLMLSDGTKIFLNAGSSLRYPDQFIGEKREVHLTGEAYFEVMSDSLHPFIVHASDVAIRVLGTSFNVKAYPDEAWVKTTLVQGQVETQCGENHVIMVPGTQVTYNKDTHETEYFPVHTRQFTSWKEGYYDFEDMPLDELMRIFVRWYNVQIEFASPELKSIQFSGRLKRYEDIKSLFNMLEYTRDVKFIVKNDRIVIQRK